jgi:type IV pilus assembly protein PilE
MRTIENLMKRHALGFTLIELMIVVAVVAILATIALPSYARYMAQLHRTESMRYLMQIAQRKHHDFLDSRAFASSYAMLGLAPVPAVVAAQYVVTIGPAVPTTPPTFIASAAPRAGSLQATYREPTLSITQDGTKSPSGVW